MQLWRISNYNDLSGKGGLVVSGRWHSKGRLVVYLAENQSLCMLETLVHLDLRADEVPDAYQLLCVDVDLSTSIMRLPDGYLEHSWSSNAPLTRSIGDQFLVKKQAALLRVPSALVPGQFNYLLNPDHPDSRLLQITSATRHPYDARFFS